MATSRTNYTQGIDAALRCIGHDPADLVALACAALDRAGVSAREMTAILDAMPERMETNARAVLRSWLEVA